TSGGSVSGGPETARRTSRSSTTTRRKDMIRTKNLIHPGEILKEEFMEPMGISQNRLAMDLRIPVPRVNAIVHPIVKDDFAEWALRQEAPIVAQESAILFEAGFQDTVDATVLIHAPKALRMQRAMQRDHATSTQIEARMAQQTDDEEKRRRADYTILNDGTADLDRQLDLLLTSLRKKHQDVNNQNVNK
ncbi:MAG: dephospho-CoA kinase, partial [Bacteroidaceae bacterium]|nr:dephospho-CoA kinase [Bacteroidaceae bacterium]